MALSLLEAEVENVSALSDQPNDNDGLSADELKAVFDAAGVAIKNYLNNTLVPELEAAINAAASGIAMDALSGSMFIDGTITADKLSQEEGLEAVTTNAVRDYAITLAKLAMPLQTIIANLQSAVNTLNSAIATKATYSALPEVAKTGNYSDLLGLPTIPVIDASVINDSTNGLQSRLIQQLVSAKADTSHAAEGTTYGMGTNSLYGHVKLSDSTNATNGQNEGMAATPYAVKQAYDLAAGKADNSHVSQIASDTALGHVKISAGTCTLSSGSRSWSNVAVTGATFNSNDIVFIAPAPSSTTQWMDNSVRPTAQGTNTLSFAASTNITAIITVNVVVIKLR